jgi:hypothetical protein
MRIAAARAEEIAAWLAARKSGAIQSFVILDDENEMGELLSRTVLIDSKTGLTEADADRALAILSE